MLPISPDLLDAVAAQTNLLAMIKEIVDSIAPQILSRPALAKENFWGAWAYRSILMTFEIGQDDRRAGFHPYGWFLHYDQPARLVFAHKATPQDNWDENDALNLAQVHFFALEQEQKRRVLTDFLRNNLTAIVE